jgi:hypothetical protein
MTALRERRTRLVFETDQEMRHRGKRRPILVMPQPWYCSVRLKGTRAVYDIAWETIFMHAAQLVADKARAERRAARKAGR